MLGHTFTERPNIKIIKTGTDVIFSKVKQYNLEKCVLHCATDVSIISGKIKAVPIINAGRYSGEVYINGTVRGRENKEQYLLAGEYTLKHGLGSILLQNIGKNDIIFKTGELFTRGFKMDRCLQVNRLQTTTESFSNESTLNIGDGISDVDKDKLTTLLENYKDCFSSNLKDLGFTTETEMVIHLEDS